MASAYSILHNYGSFIQPYNVELASQVLSYKQQKYDANKAKIEASISQVTNLDLIRDTDKEYLYGRVMPLIKDVEDFHKLDLSQDSLATAINNHIGQAVDDNVVNAYLGTMYYRNYQKEVDWYKKNRPDEYSSINENVGLLGFNKWMEDTTPGTKLNSFNYTPYFDVNGNMNKEIEFFYKQNKGRKIQVPAVNSDGTVDKSRLVEVEVNGLDRSFVQNIVRNKMASDPRYMQQMQINGTYSSLVSPQLTNNQTVSTLSDSKYRQFDSEINSIKAELKSNPSDKRRDELNAKLNYIQSSRFDFENELLNFFGVRSVDTQLDPSTVGTFIGMQHLENGATSLYQEMVVSQTVKENPGYWQGLNYARLLEKDQVDAANKRIELSIKAKKEGLELDSKGNLSVAAAPGVNGIPGATSVTDRGGQDNFNVSEEYSKTYASTKQRLNTSMDALFNGLKESDRNEAIAWTNSELSNNPDIGNMDDREKVFYYLSKNGGVANEMTANNNNLISLYNSAFDSNTQMKSMNDSMNTINSLMTKNVADNSAELLADAESNVRPVYDPSTGKWVFSNDYIKNGGDQNLVVASALANKVESAIMENNGILSTFVTDVADTAKDFPDILKNIWKGDFNKVSELVNDKTRQRSRYIEGGGDYLGIIGSNYNSPEVANLIKQIGVLNGESNVQPKDIFAQNEGGTTYVIDPNKSNAPKTAKIIAETLKFRNSISPAFQENIGYVDRGTNGGLFGTNYKQGVNRELGPVGFRDAWNDSGAYRKVVGGKDSLMNRAVEDEMLKTLGDLERGQVFSYTVKNGSKAQKEFIGNLAGTLNGAVVSQTKQAPFDPNKVTAITLKLNEGDRGLQYDYNIYTEKDGQRQVSLPYEDVVRLGLAPVEMGRFKLTPDVVKTPITLSPKYWNTDSNSNLRDYVLRANINPNDITSSGAFSNIRNNQMSSLIMTDINTGQISDYGNNIKKVLENGSDYLDVSINPYSANGISEFRQQLIYNNKFKKDDPNNGKVLIETPIYGANFLEELDNKIKFPPIMFTQLINSIVEKEYQGQKDLYQGSMINYQTPTNKSFIELMNIAKLINNGNR